MVIANPPTDSLFAIEREVKPHEDGLIELVAASLLRWKLILLTTVAGAGIAVAVALLSPVRYTATTLILPPQEQQSAASALMGQLAPLASLTGHDFGLKNPADLYVGIAKSRTVADDIVARFKIKKLYGLKTDASARDWLAAKTIFETGKDTMIKISVVDGDPKLAANIANAYVDELYTQNNRLALSESSQRRAFFEQRLHDEKEALAKAEYDLKQTEQQTGAFEISAQVQATIRSAAQLRAQIASREAVLQTLKMGATAQNPEVIQMEAEIASLRQELAQLQGKSGLEGGLIATSRVPETGLEYVRRLREVKYHETLLELLAKQFEAARLDEARAGSVIQVVDKAIPPDQKSWPPRVLLVGIGLFAGFLIGIGISCFGSQIVLRFKSCVEMLQQERSYGAQRYAD